MSNWDYADYKFTIERLLKENVRFAELDTHRLNRSELTRLISMLENDGHKVESWMVGCNTHVELIHPSIKLEYRIEYLIGKQVMWVNDLSEGIKNFGTILRINIGKIYSTTQFDGLEKELPINDINEWWWIIL